MKKGRKEKESEPNVNTGNGEHIWGKLSQKPSLNVHCFTVIGFTNATELLEQDGKVRG